MNDTAIKIYPADWAALTAADAGKPYQPCNGTEGLVFTDQWCGQCARDKAFNGTKVHIEDCAEDELCQIVAMTMMCGSTDDQRYPKEWVFGADGQPCCTAFVHMGDPIPPSVVRDDKTGDLFADSSVLPC